jgi:predicted nucleic acid-binding protein
VSYLLDASVLSELTRRRPEAKVVAWFGRNPERSLCLSVLSLGELRRGAEKVKNPARRERLRVFLERDLPARFEDRLLGVDAAVVERWGRLLAQVERPVPAIESLLAATALAHGLRIVTRHAREFRFPGLDVVDPWKV